jgi:hypothetical protein
VSSRLIESPIIAVQYPQSRSLHVRSQAERGCAFWVAMIIEIKVGVIK